MSTNSAAVFVTIDPAGFSVGRKRLMRMRRKSRELLEINVARFSVCAYIAYGGCVPRLTAVPDDDAGRSSYDPDV